MVTLAPLPLLTRGLAGAAALSTFAAKNLYSGILPREPPGRVCEPQAGQPHQRGAAVDLLTNARLHAAATSSRNHPLAPVISSGSGRTSS
jgi:hypothetical protein